MKITLLEASNKVGMTKVGLYKAIKKGKLSAEKNVDGEWLIDPSELFRVYEAVSTGTAEKIEEVSVSKPLDNSGLQREIELLREQVEGLKADKEDLKEQRDKVLKLLEENMSTVKMLTDQSATNATAKTVETKNQPEKLTWRKRIFG